MNTSPSLTYIDLFAGAGGFSQGFKEAGNRFTHVTGVELDSAAAATYRANHGRVFEGDIATWLGRETLPHADVVLGGPPCQGFSMLGKQDPDDARNKLWEAYLETIRRIQPRYFVMENVAAFAGSPAFAAMMRDLQESDQLKGRFALQHRVLNAADHGAAQSRKRVIIIGSHKDVPPMTFPAGLMEQRDVRSVIGDLPEPTTADWPERERNEAGISGPYLTRQIHIDRNYRQLSLDRFSAIPSGGNRFNLPDHLKAPCWIKHTSGSGDVMGRLHWDRPSVTIRTEFFKPEKGRYIHPEQNRAITHREAALLQGFDEDYKWFGTRTEVARQIGNAVPVPLAKALAESVLAAHDRTRQVTFPATHLPQTRLAPAPA